MPNFYYLPNRPSEVEGLVSVAAPKPTAGSIQSDVSAPKVRARARAGAGARARVRARAF